MFSMCKDTMQMHAQKEKVTRKMEIGSEELDVVEMDVMIMDVEMRSAAKEGVNGGHFETSWTRWKEFIARTSGGNRNFARGFEERRGNGNFRIKGRNIREELRGDRSRGIRRQMEEKCGIMKAQISQIDLEEIPYIVTLVVNGQQSDCLVDTGAVATLVRKRIIPDGDIDTERRTEVRLVILGKGVLVKNRVQLKYGPEPVKVLWGQTAYFHSRRGIEKDVGGVETTSRKYYWSSMHEVLPRRVLQEEKVQRKSPEREENKRDTEKGWAKWLD
ncbi:hypothetical protein JTB14_027284 [Gonioctena quinquepunctata]|nr:hypothetical protein JTB14_027284 [Gonioctena quinquepunctata]